MIDPETTWSKCFGVTMALLMILPAGVFEVMSRTVCWLRKIFDWLNDLEDKIVDWADKLQDWSDGK